MHTCYTSYTTHVGARAKPELFFFEKIRLEKYGIFARVSDLRPLCGGCKNKSAQKKLENICKIGYLEADGRNGRLPCRKKHCTDVGMEKT